MHSDDQTHWRRTGMPGATPVVLIHGLGLNEQVWQWTTPALIDAYDVITYDLYGHGRSGPPPETPSLSLFSQQLADLLDNCGVTRAVIVGFSLGGMICRRFGMDHPDRTLGLAILNSPHKRSDAAQAAILERVLLAKSEGPASTVEAALKRWFTDPFRLENPELMSVVRNWVLSNDSEIYPSIYSVLATGVAEITGQSLKGPALVLTSDEDYGNGPEMTDAIAREIQPSETLVLEGLRHMALAEQPGAVNEPLRRFLDGLERRK